MKIAFETSSVTTHNPTGIAGYAKTLISELVSIAGDTDSLVLLNKFSRLKKRRIMYRHASLPCYFYIPMLSAALRSFDILHALDAYIPSWPGAKKIVTIHDLFVFIQQDNDFFPASFMKRKHKAYRNIARHADAIIAVSQSTKNDIVRFLQFPEENIFVTHLGVDKIYYRRDQNQINYIRKKYDIPSNYLLYVGSITARKNTCRLIQAFSLSGLANDMRLILCGPLSYNSDAAIAEIQKHNLGSRVQLLNYVEKADLAALYSGARGFVYPTLYEGFGIPPLEAMACEIPVLTSNTGAAPEICGQHAVLVDPHNIEAIADGMQRLLHYTPEQIAHAKAHAQSYNWQRCAAQTMEIYRAVSNKKYAF